MQSLGLESHCATTLMLSLVHMPLASLENGCTAALSRLVQLQTHPQCVVVHHVPHSEVCDPARQRHQPHIEFFICGVNGWFLYSVGILRKMIKLPKRRAKYAL